jgi:hypothetical protein
MPLLFLAVAGIGPLFWLAHNWWWYGDALEFYRGPYSAVAIQSAQSYPGSGDWAKSWEYYRKAVIWCSGWPLVLLGLAGGLAAVLKRAIWPLLLLLLPPVFYLWSLHSGGTPIFVPDLWPFSYYNTRYGLAAAPLLAFAAAGLVACGPIRLQTMTAVLCVLFGTVYWFAKPNPEEWICWKESQVNSAARRQWTNEAALFLNQHYRGGGILTSFGDLTGVFEQAGIPLRETFHEGNGPYWQAAVTWPDVFLREEWAVAVSGDRVASAVRGRRYRCVKMIEVKGAPAVEIYKRN